MVSEIRWARRWRWGEVVSAITVRDGARSDRRDQHGTIGEAMHGKR